MHLPEELMEHCQAIDKKLKEAIKLLQHDDMDMKNETIRDSRLDIIFCRLWIKILFKELKKYSKTGQEPISK